MSHEIYYTSAPEGLKRGSSGFSTVAASENIPKALWDRLETLSAYRHHFGVHAEGAAGVAGTAGGVGGNPVSHAHWTLTVTGKTYHVLSRICDSGVDHTQRTNAFAHHLVLERTEIEAALGGPAWLLEQGGVMAERWDGRVGPIARGHLPQGDSAGPRVCRAWGAATGDPGWGGHLADLFVKTPLRPVCILFSPGQELLPLIDEALALLPAAARWNVTFNTYFTSMPTSATCLWRCCLAGTPAAQVGLRYAANGLVLDLTDRSRLPALPGGAYVEAARTGARVGPVAETTAKGKPAGGKPVSFTGKSPVPTVDPEDAADEARREAIFDFADESGNDETGAGNAVETAPDQPPAGGTAPPSLIDVAGAHRPQGTGGAARPGAKRPFVRTADAIFQGAQEQADVAAQRRRRQVMLLFVAALGAIGVGTGLVYFAYHNSVPPEAPPAPIVMNHPKPEPAKPPAPAVVPEESVQNVPPPTSRSAAAIEPTPPPAPKVIVPPPPAAPQFPETLTLAQALKRPAAGSGIGESKQTFPLLVKDLNSPAKISGIRVRFPTPNSTAVKAGDASYHNEILGTLTAAGENHGGTPGAAIRWKAPNESGGAGGAGMDVLYIAFNRSAPDVEFQWKLAALLKKPEVADLLYWVLHSSKIELEMPAAAGAKLQQIALKGIEQPAISFAAPSAEITWPAGLPKDISVTPPGAASLPKGWEASWYPDWDAKVTRTVENASQVIKFKKTTGLADVDALFLVTFRPGLTKVESTFAKRMEADQGALAENESKLRAITAKINEAAATVGGREKLGDSRGVKESLAEEQQDMKVVDAYKAVIAGYNELTHFDVGLDLPDGLRLATLHFERPDQPVEPGK